MSITERMLSSHPRPAGGLDQTALASCVDACVQCVQACTACADACLSEQMVDQLRGCVRTDLDCADICAATARVLTRQTDTDPALLRAVLAACATACQVCGDDCRRHADMHDHCRVCAEACRACQEACERLLAALA